MADDDKPTKLSDERRRREPPSDLQKSEFLRGIDIGEKSAEQRFQLAMQEIEPSVRHKIQTVYDALKNKHA